MNDQNNYQFPHQVPPPKRKFPTWARILLVSVLVGIVLICGCVALGTMFIDGDDDLGSARISDGTTPLESPTEESDDEPNNVFGMNEPARDGKFEFIVTDSTCGVDSVGDGIFEETPQGQYCLVSLTVENIGDEGQTFIDGNQKAIDSEGRKHDADSSATITHDQGVWAEDINPGNKIEAVIVFDIPANATLVGLILHDSLFSDGVEVTLE